MTSGVNKALPPVLMPKADSEGKGARDQAPRGDFAKTLDMAKTFRQPKIADAGPSRQVLDDRPTAWPRLTATLDRVINGSEEPATEAGAAMQPEKRREDEAAVLIRTANETADTEDPAQPVPDRRDPDVVPTLTPTAAPALQETPFAAPVQVAPRTKQASGEPLQTPRARAVGDIGSDRGKEASRSAEPNVSVPGPRALSFVPIGRGEQAERIHFEPATRSSPGSPEQSSVDRTPAKDILVDAPSEPARTAPRVTVLAQQNLPAPMPSTALALVETMTAGDFLETAALRLTPDAIHASASHASAQSLKIQLHPAELGMVTATLRFAGEQLSIELQVENHQAYRRLSSDSDTIVKALRDLGYEIDRVTVLQPLIAGSPAARTDAPTPMPSPQGRFAEQFGSGAANGGGAGSGEHPSEERGNARQDGRRNASRRNDNADEGLYI